MEYDSESSYEDRLRDSEAPEKCPCRQRDQKNEQQEQVTGCASWHPVENNASLPPKVPLGIVNRSLSSQVMEYYRKYSHNSNLEQYFSHSATSTSSDGVKYYYSLYELNPKPGDLQSSIPKERRRWVRPPLVGQSSGNDASGMYVRPLPDAHSLSPDLNRVTPETIPEEKSDCQETTPDVAERKVPSPTSSVASHKPLEWDSGADVGYFANAPHNKQDNKKLSTIERMALARGCSAALRLDPEGTTESGKIHSGRLSSKSVMKPEANSTAIVENVSGSESEIEITPIVKNHLPGVITGSDIASEERKPLRETNQQKPQTSKTNEPICETPKSSGLFKVPTGSPVKYSTEGKRTCVKNLIEFTSPLKKSSSMNIIEVPGSKVPLKRSQSDLNLHARDKNKPLPRLIFNSTSSIATVVNKPITCDKVIQTTLGTCSQESVGVQVSVFDEEKPPLPKRGTSLVQKPLLSILKNTQNTYKVQSRSNDVSQQASNSNIDLQSEGNETRQSSSESTESDSSPATPLLDDTENVTGRANSFEYFPGHIYENVPNGSASHVSSVDTGRSNSTMPNTSSSIDEKLWGESDSLVRDLERSVNILKSLVDANKCDKNVKKRLIHHVVKRLVTAKYTDDKIEHNLEENVPWNPDDARKKVYRAEILQALAKKQNTTDSSDDWKFQKAKSGFSKKTSESVSRAIKEMNNLESSNSDKFDRNTDRTEMDGRKARMGLRADDCDRSSNTATDHNKSESSECFMPQRNYKSSKMKNMFCMKKKCGETTTTNSSPADQNRALLDAVVNNRRSPDHSSNQVANSHDWRLPTTVSERNFELRRCSHSDSGDSKLVSYAEMEKKNQLIWITNEISHLSNLKKLLEQPKKLERAKTSPRKAKQSLYKQRLLTCMHDQNVNSKDTRRNSSDTTENSLNEHWSSHCNLASCHNIVNSAKHLRKRNSSTQTATESSDALSKTGGVMLSECPNRTTKLVNVCLQTSLQQNPGGQVVCPVHQSYTHFQSCKCPEQSFQYQRHPGPSSQHYYVYREKSQSLQSSPKSQKFYRKDDRPVISIPLSSSPTNDICADFARLNLARSNTEDNNLKQKDAKNHVNASRSKFACECRPGVRADHRVGQNCKCVLKSEEEKSEKCKKVLSRICDLCSRQIERIDAQSPVCRCNRLKHDKSCECSSDCKCGNKEGIARQSEDSVSSEKSETMFYQGVFENGHSSLKTYAKPKVSCGCSENCNSGFRIPGEAKKSCEHCGEKSEKREHQNGYCRKELSQRKSYSKPYYLTNSIEEKSRQIGEQNNRKCRCEKDCACSNKIKDIEERLNAQKSIVQREHKNDDRLKTPEKSCKCCRTCGTTYQNNRKCKCKISFPKSVAYELTFVDENRDKKNSSKSESEEIRGAGKGSSNSSPHTARSGTCSCEDNKAQHLTKDKDKKITLQECLASNKPRFLDNVETRRQYLNEISHLREMRKEKRVQLLAIASTSTFLKPTKLTKSTNHVPRKLTSADMKERLRRRYMRLNEVRSKRRQQEKQEEVRRNNLMAKIFGRKLQEKVLRGQVDLSQSVSVISNL